MMITFCSALLIITFILCLSPRYSRSIILTLAGRRQEGRAKQKNEIDPAGVIANWMRNRNTIEYLGLWETLYNPNFYPLEFEGFRNQAGLNAFTLSPSQWIERTRAVADDVVVGVNGLVATGLVVAYISK